MGKLGLQIAKLFGQKLPSFENQAEAEIGLFSKRDRMLELIARYCRSSTVFSATFTPESLKEMEKWYFHLIETNGFSSLGTQREAVEEYMAMYYGEVAVRNCHDASWIVEQYAFEPGKFEIGVRRGNLTQVLSRFTDHFKYPGNKRQQKIFREYQKYFG